MKVNRELQIIISVEDAIKLLNGETIHGDGFVLEADWNLNMNNLLEKIKAYFGENEDEFTTT